MKRKIIFALILTLLFLPSCKKNQEPLDSLDADDSDNVAYEAHLKEVEEMLNNIEKKIDIDKEEAAPMAFHDVRTSGAVGDGKTDDTAAFLAAIELAKKDGLPVY
ncbi:MAG: glycoside hydrolase family 55 protein, partial [Oscillospiraceae bacterium]|nr:glycoside hydrolase family 55 protein [Oscillospiraceae bacterium]